MPRRVQDIIPADRRSIREISIPKRVSSKTVTKTKKIENIEQIEEEKQVVEPKEIPKNDQNQIEINRMSVPMRRMPITPPSTDHGPRRKIGKWPIITIVIIIIIAIAGYFASTFYSQATFTIVPKIVPVVINSTYVAQGIPQSSGLSYEVITVKVSATSTVPSVSGPVVNTKATGKVTFTNSYSNQSVRLIAGTRLSTENGLIYRLSNSIVIPGYTKSAGNIVPGKITTNIVADQAGQNYNIPADQAVDLKIVAYAGSPKYNTIYAKLVSGTSGGFSGVKKNVSSTVLASTTTYLKSQITSQLLSDVKRVIPAGYIMYDKSSVTSFGSPIIGGNEPNLASVSLTGTMHAIIFSKEKLIETFAGQQTVALFSPFSYSAPGLETLSVSITNIKDFSPSKKGALVLSAKGEMKIVGTIPIDEIKKKLAGLSLSKTQEIFKTYSPVIESGSGELAPPWANIPTDLNKVKVIVQEP